MKYKSISKKQDESQLGKAKGESLPISFKKAVEFCRLLKGKRLSSAYKILEEVKAMKAAVPFRKYNASVAHKKNIGPGRFPVKTAFELEKILKNAEKNAVAKGLDSASLEILHISADKGPTTYKPARHRGRVAKRTHIEVVLISKKSSKKELKDIVSKAKPALKTKIKEQANPVKKEASVQKNQKDQTPKKEAEGANQKKGLDTQSSSSKEAKAPKEPAKSEDNTAVQGPKVKQKDNTKPKAKPIKTSQDGKNANLIQDKGSSGKKEQNTDDSQGAKK